MAERLLEVADIAAAAVNAAWAPTGDNVVSRAYGDEEKRHSMPGRRVYVFPIGKREVEKITRTETEWAYRLAVLTVEKCPDPGLPSDAWMDERVEFVGEKVFDVLNVDDPDDWLGTPAELYTFEIDWSEVYDFEAYRTLGCFWSVVEVELREIIAN